MTNSNQKYREVCRLIGDDTLPGVNAGEHGIDDPITNGQIFPPPVSFPPVSGSSRPTVSRSSIATTRSSSR